jgi:hypothetical protein
LHFPPRQVVATIKSEAAGGADCRSGPAKGQE